MLFERFLKRKKPAAVDPKESAAKAQAKARETLVDQARHANPETRRKAASQLLDPQLLREMLTTDADANVRAAAQARYNALFLLAEVPPEMPTADLVRDVGTIDDAQLIQRIAEESGIGELRRAAIERIAAPDLLARLAVHDGLASNRALAVDRLEDKLALEQVAREIGKKDKRVYRTAREKLKLIAEQEELPKRVRAQCEDICAKVERLGRLGNWSQDRALLDHLERQWESLEGPADPEFKEQFVKERARFLQLFEEHQSKSDAQAAQQENHAALRQAHEALLNALADGSSTTDEAELAALRERIQSEWASLEKLPPADQREFDRRLAEATGAIQSSVDAREGQRRDADRLRGIAGKLDRLLDEPKALDEKQAKSLLDQGRTMAAKQPPSEVVEHFNEAADKVESRIKTQHKHAEQRRRQLPERLAELEAHLEAGELKKADPLYQSLQAGLDLVQRSGLAGSAEREISERLRGLSPQLRELQQWRRWGADQHREGLCVDMEALIDKEMPLDTLAQQMRTLQMDWKGLDKAGSPANQALWERFHAASDSVYARCKPFLETQAAEREANRVAREGVCDQIEEFLGQVDWERVDWKRILRAERETRRTWTSIGETEGRHRKQLEKRFHQSLRQLDHRLDAERKRNQAHKQNLIERVRALAELPDLDSAIEQTKALQKEWHTTVPARQKDENKLWQSFRAACDAVFERRAARQEAHANEQRDNLTTREAICAEALAFAESEDDPKRLANAQREFEERWRSTQSLQVPRQAVGQLNQRWQAARDALVARRRQGQDAQHRAELALLQRQSDVCARIESGALNGANAPMSAEEALSSWQALPAQSDPAVQEAMEARYKAAVSAAQDPGAAAELRARLDENAERRALLCLQLEIIAGVESPTELAQQRLEYQVARLAERMSEGEGDSLQDATQLLRDWYLCGPAPQDAGLEARVQRVVRSLTAPREKSPQDSAQTQA